MPVDGVLQIYNQKYNSTNDLRVNTEGIKATYGVVGAGITPASATTDIVTIYGYTNKKIRIKKIIVTGLSTTAGTMNVNIVKRTAANTGGTSTAPTIGKYDSSDAAAVATVAVYTANPTSLGAGVAVLGGALNFGLAGSVGELTFDFSNRNDKPITLNSATEGMAINLNADTVPAGAKFGYAIEWEEV